MSRKMKKVVCLIAVMTICICILSGCVCESTGSDGRRKIIMEVIHPETGEIIEDLETVRFSHDGKANIPKVKLRLDCTNDYMSDEFLDDLVLFLAKENDNAHIMRPWSEWPSEIGRYSIEIYFNYSNEPYEEYYEARVKMWLIIT